MTRIQVWQTASLTLLWTLIACQGVMVYRLHRLRRRMEALSAETDAMFERYQQLTKRCLEFLADPYNPRWRDGDIFKGIEGAYGGRGGPGVH